MRLDRLGPIARAWFPFRLGMAWLPALGLGAMLACDWGGGAGSPLAPVLPLPGIWQGTANPQQGPSGEGYLLVMPDQSFRFLSSAGITEVSGIMTLGGYSLGGTGTWYTRLDSVPSMPVTLSGTASSSPEQILDLFISGSSNVLQCGLGRDPLANVPMQPAQLAGTYTSSAANNSGNVLETITIPADGLSFTGKHAERTFDGTLTQIQGLNAFAVKGSFPAAEPGQTPLNFSGFAYLRPGTPAAFILITDAAATGGTAVVSGIYTGR